MPDNRSTHLRSPLTVDENRPQAPSAIALSPSCSLIITVDLPVKPQPREIEGELFPEVSPDVIERLAERPQEVWHLVSVVHHLLSRWQRGASPMRCLRKLNSTDRIKA